MRPDNLVTKLLSIFVACPNREGLAHPPCILTGRATPPRSDVPVKLPCSKRKRSTHRDTTTGSVKTCSSAKTYVLLQFKVRHRCGGGFRIQFRRFPGGPCQRMHILWQNQYLRQSDLRHQGRKKSRRTAVFSTTYEPLCNALDVMLDGG
jgi:hypothetical protein